jgi:catalase
MTEPERQHIVAAFAFELGRVENAEVHARMIGRLRNVDETLAKQVAETLGMSRMPEKLKPAAPVRDTQPSPPLSQYKNMPRTLSGRKIGVLISQGADAKLLKALEKRLDKEQATMAVVAPSVHGIKDSAGAAVDVDFAIDAGPSVLFDAILVAPSKDGASELLNDADAVDFVRQAFLHQKTIGFTRAATELLASASAQEAEGVCDVSGGSFDAFINSAKNHRVWERRVA